MSEPDDQDLWDAVVAAQAGLAARRADFYQNARSPARAIARGLRGQPREQVAALRFLASFGFLREHMELLPDLIEMAQSHRWALGARQAIGGAGQDRLIPALEEQIPPLLQTADPDDLRRLAELLAHVHAWSLLGQLAGHAAASADPDAREVGDDFTSSYGPLWQHP